jgi:hypothetical protein
MQQVGIPRYFSLGAARDSYFKGFVQRALSRMNSQIEANGVPLCEQKWL